MNKEYYQNHQWKVTTFGIESVKPNPVYPIEKERLAETTKRAGQELYEWPIHMAEKSWVDLEAFIEAFKQAIVTHEGAYKGKIDGEMLELTLAEAHSKSR